MKEEKPRSRVMPRSLDCGCLSKAAVDPTVLQWRVSIPRALSERSCTGD